MTQVVVEYACPERIKLIEVCGTVGHDAVHICPLRTPAVYIRKVVNVVLAFTCWVNEERAIDFQKLMVDLQEPLDKAVDEGSFDAAFAKRLELGNPVIACEHSSQVLRQQLPWHR
ncbi:hypothetical protein D3C85_977470 [compost metagenome]